MLQENNLAKEELPIELIEATINLFQEKHIEFTKQFYSTCNSKLNLKKIRMCELKENYDLLQIMSKYLKSLASIVDDEFMTLEPNDEFRWRVKCYESVLKKIKFYNTNKQNGTYPITKSLNDLFGGRLILPNINNNKDELLECLNQLKSCKNSCIYRVLPRNISDEDYTYRAFHIYFQLENYCFPWELQIWDCKDEKSNYESHQQHEKNKLQ